MAKKTYNYKRFRFDYFDLKAFVGPRAGERFPPLQAEDVEGDTVSLKDLRGRWVVLELGSLTCPMYAARVPRMQALQEKFPDVAFRLLYVREAHPGERTSAHETFSDKRDAARKLPQAENERRPVLIDRLDGSHHQRLGELPNSIYVLNPKGRVAFRLDWNDPDLIEAFLENREQSPELERDRADPPKPGPFKSLRVLLRGGVLALFDLLRGLPRLVRQRYAARQAEPLDGASDST